MSELAEALASWLKAVKELKEAEQECVWDQGYFLRDHRERVARTEERFLDHLIERIEERKNKTKKE